MQVVSFCVFIFAKAYIQHGRSIDAVLQLDCFRFEPHTAAKSVAALDHQLAPPGPFVVLHII